MVIDTKAPTALTLLMLLPLLTSACATPPSNKKATSQPHASTATPVRSPAPINPTPPEDQPAQTPLRADAPRATPEQLEQLVQDQLLKLRDHDQRAIMADLLSDKDLTSACEREPDEETLAQSKQEQFAASDLATCQHIDWTKTSMLYWRGGQPLQPHYDCPNASTLHADIEVHLSLLDEPERILIVTLQSPTLLYATKRLSLELPPRCAMGKRPASPAPTPTP